MNKLKWSIGGWIAATITLGALAGCGGTGSANNGGSGNPHVDNQTLTGGVTTTTVACPVAINNSSTPTEIDVVLPGTTVPQAVFIPAGLTVAAGASIAVIPKGTTFFSGLSGGASGAGGTDVTRDGPLPGTITCNGNAAGALVFAGQLSQNLGIPAGNYTLDLYGPFTVSNGPQALTVQEFSFTFESNGTATSLATSISGTIPVNGANNVTNVLNAYFQTPYRSGTGTFQFTDTNGTVTQNDPVDTTTGLCIIHDYTTTSGGRQIPASGVQVVSFVH